MGESIVKLVNLVTEVLPEANPNRVFEYKDLPESKVDQLRECLNSPGGGANYEVRYIFTSKETGLGVTHIRRLA